MEFRLAGARIRVSFFFLLMLALFLLQDQFQLAPILIFSMLFHELGHLLLLCLWGKRITGLTLTPFGIGITTPTTTRLSYGKEISIVLAGSLVNLLLAGIFYCLPNGALASAINLVMGLFNLLPILPLDGGQALNYWMERRGAVSWWPAYLVTGLALALLYGLSFALALRGRGYGMVCASLFLTIQLIWRRA